MQNKLALMFVRYIVLAILALNSLYVIYLIVFPITIYPLVALFTLVDSSSFILGNIIAFKGEYIGIVRACLAGAAYYLLLILNLSTPMNTTKRAKSLVFLLISFLIINILRIFAFSLLFVSGFYYFDLAHELSWYVLSIILVIILWFTNVKIFKIKAVPVYTDITSIINLIKIEKKKRK